jgi:peptidoglycan/LPS O-acetylase OafA/YrhL
MHKKNLQHFERLDGLRGIAALVVVVFHFMEWVFPDFSKNLLAHGFLAVDFFFCLSGFVIGYAYDHRIKQLGFWKFFKLRLIRLHPLVIIGSLLGLFAFLLDPYTIRTIQEVGTVAVLFVGSIFMIPMPWMEERAYNLFYRDCFCQFACW